MKMREYWNNFCAEPKKCPAVLVAPLFFMNMNIFYSFIIVVSFGTTFFCILAEII